MLHNNTSQDGASSEIVPHPLEQLLIEAGKGLIAEVFVQDPYITPHGRMRTAVFFKVSQPNDAIGRGSPIFSSLKEGIKQHVASTYQVTEFHSAISSFFITNPTGSRIEDYLRSTGLEIPRSMHPRDSECLFAVTVDATVPKTLKNADMPPDLRELPGSDMQSGN